MAQPLEVARGRETCQTNTYRIELQRVSGFGAVRLVRHTEQRVEFDDPSTSFGPGPVRLLVAGRVTLLKKSHTSGLNELNHFIKCALVGCTLRPSLPAHDFALIRPLAGFQGLG